MGIAVLYLGDAMVTGEDEVASAFFTRLASEVALKVDRHLRMAGSSSTWA